MRALVTGSAGFIGGHLCAELKRQGHSVFPADLKHGLDLSWPDELCGLPDVDVVFHLAAFTGVRASVEKPYLCQRHNVLATQNILQWCVDRGIKRLVFASSSSIYGDGPTPFQEDQAPRPMSPYAASKIAGEALCYAYHRLYGMDITVLRFFTVYGPNGRKDMAVGRFLAQMKAGKPITINGDGTQQRDFTYVGDVVGAIIEAAGLSGWNVLNVGAGHPMSVVELVQLLEDALSVEARVQWAGRNRADVPVTHADTDRLESIMDWKPTPLADGLRLIVGADNGRPD